MSLSTVRHPYAFFFTKRTPLTLALARELSRWIPFNRFGLSPPLSRDSSPPPPPLRGDSERRIPRGIIARLRGLLATPKEASMPPSKFGAPCKRQGELLRGFRRVPLPSSA
eukprot:570968-Prorocentrum_minimum.AAC.1